MLAANDIEFEFLDFYHKLYTKDTKPRFLPTNLDWCPISEQQAAFLETVFTEDEVLLAVNSLGSRKALGPNGFTVEFFKDSWNTMKGDIMAMFRDFFANGIINVALKETYICLIPKKVDAKTGSD